MEVVKFHANFYAPLNLHPNNQLMDARHSYNCEYQDPRYYLVTRKVA
jgi:hypothetical protein